MVDGAFVGPEVIPEPISLSAAPEHRLEIQARGTGAVVKAVEVVLVGVYPQYALELHEILANTRDPLEPDLER